MFVVISVSPENLNLLQFIVNIIEKWKENNMIKKLRRPKE